MTVHSFWCMQIMQSEIGLFCTHLISEHLFNSQSPNNHKLFFHFITNFSFGIEPSMDLFTVLATKFNNIKMEFTVHTLLSREIIYLSEKSTELPVPMYTKIVELLKELLLLLQRISFCLFFPFIQGVVLYLTIFQPFRWSLSHWRFQMWILPSNSGLELFVALLGGVWQKSESSLSLLERGIMSPLLWWFLKFLEILNVKVIVLPIAALSLNEGKLCYAYCNN